MQPFQVSREAVPTDKSQLVIIGNSQPMVRLKQMIKRVATSKADTILVHGESGSGKELVARAIHEWSDHSKDPFVEINCASIPESLLESELLGYEKGAFTDAKERKLGLFEIAGNGTVFLDEIGEMPAKLQAKLLRVLEYRRFKRLGGTKDIEFSGRIVVATNRNLEEEIQNGNFRADLYYRLNIVPITVPPLRERSTDIPDLVDHLLGKISGNLGVDKPKVSPDAMKALVRHPWHGNVRELRNILQRTIIFHQPIVVTPDLLELHVAEQSLGATGATTRPSLSNPVRKDDGKVCEFLLPMEGIDLEDLEKSMLIQALERARYNQTKAATLLHVTRHTLRYRLEKFGLLTGAV